MFILRGHNHSANYEFAERKRRSQDVCRLPNNPPIEVERTEEERMSKDRTPSPDRRRFLKGAGVAAASLPILIVAGDEQAAPGATEPAPQTSRQPNSAGTASGAGAGYQILSLDEAAFTEALVDHMWPKDQFSPSGSEIGLATFIDRQLAGAFGQGDRLYAQAPFRKGKPQHGYQLPLTPAEYFKAGVGAAAAACERRFHRRFDKLTDQEREQFLQDVASGKVSEGPLDLAAWFNGLVYPLFERGAFADPIYGGNRDKAAWRMIGYPGLPATYGQDVVRYRGKPHPRSMTPQSIQDLS
jgi:gluconate 2-dehydrogenase gamma chain